jgi:hypothetical protein
MKYVKYEPSDKAKKAVRDSFGYAIWMTTILGAWAVFIKHEPMLAFGYFLGYVAVYLPIAIWWHHRKDKKQQAKA